MTTVATVRWKEPERVNVSDVRLGGLLELEAETQGGRRLKVLVDTGASISFIKAKAAEELELQKVKKEKVKVELADGKEKETTGLFKVPLKMGSWKGVVDLQGLELSEWDVVLGMDWLKAWKVVIEPAKGTVKVKGHTLKTQEGRNFEAPLPLMSMKELRRRCSALEYSFVQPT